MPDDSHILHHQKLISVISLIVTLGIIYFVDLPVVVLGVLLPLWLFIFLPWCKAEIIMFFIASVFFLEQNYLVLTTGGFVFKYKNVLLMPYYEPFMWGFYFLNMKRFMFERQRVVVLDKRSILGLVLTAFTFSLFSKNSDTLFVATLFSTIVLLCMFHEPFDIYYAIYALILGFIVELFGVSTGLWSYPAPDFLGIPWWFATMWLSVGLLGRRFLIPLAEWLAEKLSAYLA